MRLGAVTGIVAIAIQVARGGGAVRGGRQEGVGEGREGEGPKAAKRPWQRARVRVLTPARGKDT